MNQLIKRAHNFAEYQHRAVNQLRKYTNKPYIVHPEAVAKIVESVGGTPSMIAAAYLHDVVEDTPVTIEEIKDRFGKCIARYVADLTDVAKPSDGNRATRVALNRAHSAAACPQAQTIKLADLIDNTSTITEYDPAFAVTYMREKRALLEVLTKGHSILYTHAWELVNEWEKISNMSIDHAGGKMEYRGYTYSIGFKYPDYIYPYHVWKDHKEVAQGFGDDKEDALESIKASIDRLLDEPQEVKP